MKRDAVDQAEDRLNRAMLALDRLASAERPELADKAWSEFLVAVGGIYGKLGSGAKGNRRSEAWWGKKIHERRTDSLLAYLHHARNADEHTTAPLSDYEAHLSFDGVATVGIATGSNDTILSLKNPSIKVVGISVGLASVLDRTGKTIQPPTSNFDLQERFSPIRAAGVATV